MFNAIMLNLIWKTFPVLYIPQIFFHKRCRSIHCEFMLKLKFHFNTEFISISFLILLNENIILIQRSL